MSILTVLSMSSISTLWSSSLTSSGNQLVDMVAMARQNSISKNAYTAVVIKSQGTGAYSAYCLLQSTPQDDGTFGAWTAITPWHFLGRGITFDSGSNDTFAAANGTLPAPLPTSFSFQGQSIDLTSTSVYQCYQPDGTLTSQPTTTRMVLRLIRNANPSASTVNYYDLVFVANTGMAKIERP